MRWVWRAQSDSGAFKAEYAALIMLIAVVTAAVVAMGLPTEVRSLYDTALCRVEGDDDCETLADGGQDTGDSDGTGDSGGDGSGDDPTAEPSPGTDGEGDGEEGGEGETADDPDEIEPVFNDPLIDPEVADAQDALDEAEAEHAAAQEEYDGIDGELMTLLGEILGIEDARKCITEGDIIACIWTVIGFAPWGKGAKLIAKSPKILRLWNRWRRVSGRLDTAADNLDTASSTRNRLLRACEANSFSAGTLVLMADGTRLAIEDVTEGDAVLATDPATGTTGPRAVTGLITGSGSKDLVEIRVNADGRAAGAVTATAEHPFWEESDGTWVTAAELRTGDTLRTAEGDAVSVASTSASTIRTSVYNLTVDDLRTYYISLPGTAASGAGAAGPAGGFTDVLTHNAGPGCGDIWMDPNRIEHHFKHAADFGVTGKWNKQTRVQYLEALGHFMRSPNNRKITGTYRGQPAHHYVDPDTGQHVSVAADGPEVGKVIAAWKTDPGDPQLEYLLRDGVL
ncbi:polymorphic toxin-type HINT domain-containing protein [Nocardiopsis mangrovi]|uniref:Polymorphic toxin-type HINT domain-containing protein n=1 Tax=Nocardiopsis mangrovi TaxID=1179818 RepID=A0ABV9E1D1_9ACTN